MTISLSHPGPWMAAAAAPLAVAVLWYYFSLKMRLSRPRAAFLAFLRCLTYALVIILVAEPVVVSERKEHFRPVVPVGIDSSLSMGLKGGMEDSRFDRARLLMESLPFSEALEEYYTEFFVFDESARRVTPETLEKIATDGRWTDVRLAVTESLGRENAGALVILTDGSHRKEDIIEAMESSPVPLILMKIDGGEEPRDAEVVAVDGADIAFTGRPVDLEVTVRAEGFAGRELPVVLKEGGKVVSSRPLTFPQNSEAKKISFSWSPPGPGRYHLSVEIPPQAGEEVSLNNAVHLPVEVRRDKIRILLVSGRPSWNYRFIREALKGDPTVDLISFIILRAASDVVDVPQDELSLIPFPTRKIFLEELENFDLIIFENFSFRFYFPQQYLAQVKEFVAQGGGFWMLGGPLSFAGGGYAGTTLAEVLPVRFQDITMEGGYREGSFRAAVTPGGEHHPLLRGLDRRDYEKLPLLEGYNRSSGPAGKAVVLLEHAADGEPLLAIGRYGEGRALTLMTNSIWKWNFEMAAQGRGKTFFLSLIRQAVRWTVGDPLMEPVRVSLPKDLFMTGEKLEGTVRVFTEDFVPASDPDLTVSLRKEAGETATLPLEKVSDGVYEFVVPVPTAGTYEVTAAARADGEIYGSDTAAFSVAWPAGEFRGGDGLSAGLPGRLSERGHRIITVDDPVGAASRLASALAESAPPYRVLTEEKKGLGEEWWAFTAIFSLLACEWFFRRRFGVE